MGLSFGCIKCWETPCQCGWEYKDKMPEQMADHIRSIVQYRLKGDAISILFAAIDKIRYGEQKWKLPESKVSDGS